MLHVNGHKGMRLVKEPVKAADYIPQRQALWQDLYAGSLLPPDVALCGPIGAVPPLPNPFVLLSDGPALVAQMLEHLPQELRDTKAFQPPSPIEGLPGLCHGPGGLLPSHTPRQLAQNLLAASLMNRLCANLLTAAARCAADLGTAKPGPSPEESAMLEAQRRLQEAKDGELLSCQEEAEACQRLQAFQQSGEADAKQQHELESIVGWKSSVRVQLAAELEDAKRECTLAEEKLLEAGKRKRTAPWHEQWPGVLPSEAAENLLFCVRLTARSPELFTVREFLEAMQLGLIDRTGAGFVTKHAVECAFVSSAADYLLLCLRSSDDPPGAVQAKDGYRHILAPTCVGTGLVRPGTKQELRTPRPQHTLVVRVEGQTFPFIVQFGPFNGEGCASAFAAVGAHAHTYYTPWNPMIYGDILWEREARDAFSMLPVIATLGALVVDPDITFGIFPSVPRTQSVIGGVMSWPATSEDEVPLGCAGIAMVQGALFNDVKMWPIVLPDILRLRWDYGLRTLRHLLMRQRDECEHTRSRGSETVLDEALPQLLQALPRVPNDDGLSGAGGCAGLGDRLKRMELSMLAQYPLRSSREHKQCVSELSGLWPYFERDTKDS